MRDLLDARGLKHGSPWGARGAGVFMTDEGREAHHAAVIASAPIGSDGPGRGGWPANVLTVLSGAAGTVGGITPHVLHHLTPIAGAALVTGTTGGVLFGLLGFALTAPMLLRLRRRFGTWLAPGIALAFFAVMFTVSTLWIGPAIRCETGTEDVRAPLDEHGH